MVQSGVGSGECSTGGIVCSNLLKFCLMGSGVVWVGFVSGSAASGMPFPLKAQHGEEMLASDAFRSPRQKSTSFKNTGLAGYSKYFEEQLTVSW